MDNPETQAQDTEWWKINTTQKTKKNEQHRPHVKTRAETQVLINAYTKWNYFAKQPKFDRFYYESIL
jgi:hypothetical protein